jgi:2-isopropylmalate synthase
MNTASEPDFTKTRITLFDTTLRDGELTPGVKLDIPAKIRIAKLLEAMRVDVIEVGYPGARSQDFDAILMVSKQIKEATICGLASCKPDEIASVALALKPAARSRINIFTPVNLKNPARVEQEQTLAMIRDSIGLARGYRANVEWSAFDAARSERDFLCRAVEAAISAGATTVCIPDTMGTTSPERFTKLIVTLVNQVPNIDRAAIAVHCHDDQGLAVQSSMAALDAGARQIECALNGLGARKGNADLTAVVQSITQSQTYEVDIDPALLGPASELVAQITGVHPHAKWERGVEAKTASE